MELLPGMAISSSALTAEKLRMDLISNNVANMNTTRTEEGGPYKKKMPVFAERLREAIEGDAKGYGVEVRGIVEDDSPPKKEYRPDHPDAGEDGYVELPDINIVNEMTDLIGATRAYESNVTVLNASKQMAMKALELGR